MKRIGNLYNKVPPVISSFLIKALIIFVLWQVLYRCVLQPTRIPDRALTNITCFSTTQLLSVFYTNVVPLYTHSNSIRSAIVTIDGKKIIGIADPCNALDIFVLYIAFLYCFPGNRKRRIWFIAGGIPYIFLINTIRCALIAWLNINHRSWVDVSHHYIFTALVYMMVFYVWVLYSNSGYDISRKVMFVVSLALILLSSWANVDYFGSAFKNQYSFTTNQVAHCIALMLTGLIGYINWWGKERWVRWLWSAMYLLAIVIFTTLFIMFSYSGNFALKMYAASLRNTFTGPLPFLMFTLFIQVARQFTKTQTIEKISA